MCAINALFIRICFCQYLIKKTMKILKAIRYVFMSVSLRGPFNCAAVKLREHQYSLFVTFSRKKALQGTFLWQCLLLDAVSCYFPRGSFASACACSMFRGSSAVRQGCALEAAEGKMKQPLLGERVSEGSPTGMGKNPWAAHLCL